MCCCPSGEDLRPEGFYLPPLCGPSCSHSRQEPRSGPLTRSQLLEGEGAEAANCRGEAAGRGPAGKACAAAQALSGSGRTLLFLTHEVQSELAGAAACSEKATALWFST